MASDPVVRFAEPAHAATWLGRVAGAEAPDRLLPGGDVRLSSIADPAGALIRLTVRTRASDGTVAQRRRDGVEVPPGMAEGLLTLEAVLAPGDHALSLRFDGARLELHVDGVLVDEEWPLGPVLPAAGTAPGWRAWPRCLDDAALAAWHGRTLVDPSAAGPFAAAYWRPPGRGTAIGDVMLRGDGERLHLFWLYDRRGHGSRWVTGAHQIRHAASDDLRSFHHRPHAITIRRPWEGYGTGCVIIDGNGTWHLFYQVHGERYAEGAGQIGIWTATSADGDQWLEHAARGPGVGDPCVYRAEGRWHLVAWGRRHASDDLRSWRLEDARFLPVGDLPASGMWSQPPEGVARQGEHTFECPCVWTWNGWTYALMGQSGYWMSRSPLGPFWSPRSDDPAIARPRWSIYDGLFVPMAALWRGRCLLAGFLFGRQMWGGVVVWRELLQEADGTLAMRWVPEMVPPAAAWSAPRDALIERAPLACGELPEGGWRLSAVVHTASAACELRIGDEACLVIEPAMQRVRWAVPVASGGLPVEPSGRTCHGRDTAITAVEGLDAPVAIEVLAWRDRDGWVLDACIGGRRTLVCWRDRLGRHLEIAAHGGSVELSGLAIAAIATP